MVCGIVAIVLAFIPLMFFVALPLGILAIVFGIVGMRRGKRGEATNRGMAIAGFITGLIATVGAIIAFAIMNAAVNAIDDAVNNVDTSTPATLRSAQQHLNRQEHRLIHRGILITNQ